MEEKVVQLKYPIQVPTSDGGVIEASSIRLGRLKAKHMRLLPQDFMQRGENATISPAEMLPIISSLSGIPIESIDEIDIEDLIVIGQELESFFAGQSPRTGRK